LRRHTDLFEVTYYYYYYYYLTAIGLTPGGSSIHLHTNSTQNTEDGTHITMTREKITIQIKISMNLCEEADKLS
jgi:hypothetical protein